jgi:tRNA pseudouridine55 synthase
VEVERAARPVTVERFDLSATDEPGVLRAEVVCSSGTYVRVLAADLGRALGGGGHLRRLRRTAIGNFGVDQASPLDDLSTDAVLPPIDAVRGHPAVAVDDALAARVANGAVLDLVELGVSGAGPWAVTDGAGALLAVYEHHRDDRAKPAVVLHSR